MEFNLQPKERRKKSCRYGSSSTESTLLARWRWPQKETASAPSRGPFQEVKHMRNCSSFKDIHPSLTRCKCLHEVAAGWLLAVAQAALLAVALVSIIAAVIGFTKAVR